MNQPGAYPCIISYKFDTITQKLNSNYLQTENYGNFELKIMVILNLNTTIQVMRLPIRFWRYD